MDVKDHSTGGVANDGIGVGCGAVKQVSKGCGSGFSALGLLGGESAKCCEHGVVNSACIKKKSSYDLLQTFDALFVKRWADLRFCHLLCCSIFGRGPWVGRILGGRGFLMHESVEGFFNVSIHGQVHGSIVIVPVQVNSTKFGSRPVTC